MEGADLNAIGGAVEWLEEEHRQHKAGVFKLQQAVEQVQSALWTLSDRVNTVESSINAVSGHGARVARVEEEARLARDQGERLESRIEAFRDGLAKEERARTAEGERDRLERAALGKNQDALERADQALVERIQAVEELARRRQEDFFQVNQTLDLLRVQDDKLNALISAQQTQLKHQMQEIEGAQHVLLAVQAQDEIFQGRVQHLSEQLRRLEAQEELHEVAARFAQMLSEQGELHKVERMRLERSMVEVQMGYEQHRSQADDQRQELIHVQGQLQALNEHLDHVRESLWEFRNEIIDHFTGVAGVEEQRRRRQLTETEQQIKELAAWKPKPPRS
ncbi:MAG: hypothetical protein EXR51_04560 [Dehalococcoidia bacterium]|nr:hypothetical protein [Dehalococcoidia bacterium]